jgi:hypothetical protein
MKQTSVFIYSPSCTKKHPISKIQGLSKLYLLFSIFRCVKIGSHRVCATDLRNQYFVTRPGLRIFDKSKVECDRDETEGLWPFVSKQSQDLNIFFRFSIFWDETRPKISGKISKTKKKTYEELKLDRNETESGALSLETDTRPRVPCRQANVVVYRPHQVAWAWLEIDTFAPKSPILNFKFGERYEITAICIYISVYKILKKNIFLEYLFSFFFKIYSLAKNIYQINGSISV